jgi:hypothetical protein
MSDFVRNKKKTQKTNDAIFQNYTQWGGVWLEDTNRFSWTPLNVGSQIIWIFRKKNYGDQMKSKYIKIQWLFVFKMLFQYSNT